MQKTTVESSAVHVMFTGDTGRSLETFINVSDLRSVLTFIKEHGYELDLPSGSVTNLTVDEAMKMVNIP